MADITKIRLTKGEESNEYNIADSTARNTANAAQTAATGAQAAANKAQTTATAAQTAATGAQKAADRAQTTATAAQTAASKAQADINSLVYAQASVEDSALVLTEKTGTGA